MRLRTQDGRTLKLSKRDRVEFQAVTYAGYVNRNIFYVAATIRPRKRKHSRIRVCLGEYATREAADNAEKMLTAAFEANEKFFVMPENKGVAPKDDLMKLIETADELFPRDYWLEIGMINGETNSSYGINPDTEGSYAKKISAWQSQRKPA